MNNLYIEVGAMPSLSVYIRKDLYRKMILECDRLRMGESEFINTLLEGYFNVPGKAQVPAGTRLVHD